MASEIFPENKDASTELLFGASSELVERISQALDHGDFAQVGQWIEGLHSADMADLIVRLAPEAREKFVDIFKSYITAETLAELDDSIRKDILEILGTKEIAAAVSELESDDALDLISDLEEDQQQEVLRAIPADERAILEEVLTYPEGSVGRLMQREIVCVPPFWTVGETVSFVRDTHGLPENFYTIYVVDSRHHPLGEIYLSALLRHHENTPVSEIMGKIQKVISVDQDEGEVVDLFQHYNLVSAPVVDASGHIVGMVMIDDVFDVAEEETEKEREARIE